MPQINIDEVKEKVLSDAYRTLSNTGRMIFIPNIKNIFQNVSGIKDQSEISKWNNLIDELISLMKKSEPKLCDGECDCCKHNKKNYQTSLKKLHKYKLYFIA